MAPTSGDGASAGIRLSPRRQNSIPRPPGGPTPNTTSSLTSRVCFGPEPMRSVHGLSVLRRPHVAGGFPNPACARWIDRPDVTFRRAFCGPEKRNHHRRIIVPVFLCYREKPDIRIRHHSRRFTFKAHSHNAVWFLSEQMKSTITFIAPYSTKFQTRFGAPNCGKFYARYPEKRSIPSEHTVKSGSNLYLRKWSGLPGQGLIRKK